MVSKKLKANKLSKVIMCAVLSTAILSVSFLLNPLLLVKAQSLKDTFGNTTSAAIEKPATALNNTINEIFSEKDKQRIATCMESGADAKNPACVELSEKAITGNDMLKLSTALYNYAIAVDPQNAGEFKMLKTQVDAYASKFTSGSVTDPAWFVIIAEALLFVARSVSTAIENHCAWYAFWCWIRF